MASIDATIVLIALPAIFRGIQINPLSASSFQYLLWIMFGYSIVTATLLVTFGRLSDMFGRVKLYNLGFAIFTVGSILLSLTPNTGNTGALELIIFRLVQGVGAAFIFSNSGAIITDAFPRERKRKSIGNKRVIFPCRLAYRLGFRRSACCLRLASGLSCQCSSRRYRHSLVVLET